RRGWSLAVGAATLATAAALMVWLRPSAPLGGERTADHSVSERTTFNVGGRATAVAEGGSALAWKVTPGGKARVEQRAGDVFYRVEKGGPFVVSTPAGEVTVLGTCFRVELRPTNMETSVDKKSMVAASVGALVATTILVTVYEGRVLLANERGRAELHAGDRGTAEGAGAPSRQEGGATTASSAVPAPAPPSLDATREELLKRDEVQRSELAQLRARVQQLQQEAGGDPHKRDDNSDRFFKPTKDELQQMAKECKLKWDVPTLGLTSPTLGEKAARESGLSDEERRQIDAVTAEFNGRMVSQLRALYVEVTGDKAGAETLTPHAMEQEIQSKVPDAAGQETYWRLSRERAGLIPPGDPKSGAPIDRLMRLLTSAGDEYERELGGAIGPDRAHALRAEHGGWGSRSVGSMGCPEGR
ncbi:MAG: hypothetical protein JWN44_3288, partial [Myxococcales bacterium]|nr:hypothetical protein [Myxococcales bacterium]